MVKDNRETKAIRDPAGRMTYLGFVDTCNDVGAWLVIGNMRSPYTISVWLVPGTLV